MAGLDIGQLVQAYNAGTRALLKAAGLPESMYADPAVQAAVPPAAAVAAAPAAKKKGRPLTAAERFVSNAGKYRQSHGGQLGLIEQLAMRHSPQVNVKRGTVTGPISVVQNPSGANPLERVTRTNAAGQVFQEYDLGGGQAAHIYYGPGGTRQVKKFRR